jgi:hypothetical protein
MADPDNAGAGAYSYMKLMGLVVLGWMWLKMVQVSGRSRRTARRPRIPRSEADHRALLRRPRASARRFLEEAGRGRREAVMKLPEEAF